MGGGLVTLEKVKVIHYRDQARGKPEGTLAEQAASTMGIYSLATIWVCKLWQGGNAITGAWIRDGAISAKHVFALALRSTARERKRAFIG